MEKFQPFWVLEGNFNDKIACRLGIGILIFWDRSMCWFLCWSWPAAKKTRECISTRPEIFQAELASFFLNGEKVISETNNFMNEKAVLLLTYYGLDIKIYWLFDDLDMEVRNTKGSAGGLNGIKSIINILVQVFNRVGRSKKGMSVCSTFW